MNVLRIQNEHSSGPYVNGPMELYHQINVELDHRPPPESDNGIDRFPNKDEYCGFENQKQLDNWFDDYGLELLESYGYFVVELSDVTITAFGEFQVLYKI